MITKSERAKDHINHLRETFTILREHGMKLNTNKYAFGIKYGKFLEYVVHARGIEANPDKIKAIVEMKSPSKLKEIQKLIGCIAALNWFISRAFDNCHPSSKS